MRKPIEATSRRILKPLARSHGSADIRSWMYSLMAGVPAM
ncbi:Uncharacterised protein [Bordetella pertussis]|nr:Uncharacterised protein [Bordetella pertussis]